MSEPSRRLEKALYRQVKETCERYQLLAPGDRVLVAMSGGKDSYTMFELLTRLVPRLPFAVELVAVHLDQRQPGYDGAGLEAWLDASGWPFEILSEDTYSVVTEQLAEGKTYCSLCSRLRRGILYTAAERLGCNKLALGHHRDDSLETFLLNLFYSGKLQAMPASYRTDDGRFEVIRPLIECAERRHRRVRRRRRLPDHPVQPVRLAGRPAPRRDDPAARPARGRQPARPQRHGQRAAQRPADPSARPRRRRRLGGAPRRGIRPAVPSAPRPVRAAAEPVVRGGRRLRVID